MKAKALTTVLAIGVMAVVLSACGGEQPIDVKAITAKPQTYVGSDTCKMCHLEHYDSWKMTLHSRTLQNAQNNRDVVVVDFDSDKIRKSLEKLGGKLQVPPDQVFIPKPEEIRYTIGSQWKQGYIVEKKGSLLVAPVQYNIETHNWSAYHEADWEQRDWFLNCGGCHTTGVDLEKKTFVEPSVGCEACHGKGSWHAALPKTAVFEKRQTIVNPAKLTLGVSAQICGSCHNRGTSTKVKEANWPVGYAPGRALEPYYLSEVYPESDVKVYYANDFTKGHHQQYLDWLQSQHVTEGVTCTSCHYVHQIGLPPTRSQTVGAGSRQCFECHNQMNKTAAHAIHTFANCIGCHMPKIVTSAESGVVHSHVFICLKPQDTLKNPKLPNSCQSCHAHKMDDLKKLQEKAFPGSSDLDW
jgi:Cytochrome c554 and c-prime